LRNLTKNKPDFFLEKLQEDFYKWLDASGINVDNCPSELAQCLVNVSEVLKGKGDEFAKVRREEARKNIEKMSEEEWTTKLNEVVISYYEPLENEDIKAKSLEGQTYKDVNNKSKFAGNADRGKEIFKQIERGIKEHQAIEKKLKAQRDYKEWEREQEEMEGVESSSSTANYQQKYPKSDLKKIGNADKSNKGNDSKVGTIATVSIFSALVIGGVVLVARNRLSKKIKK